LSYIGVDSIFLPPLKGEIKRGLSCSAQFTLPYFPPHFIIFYPKRKELLALFFFNWSIFTTSLELILSEIPDKNQCPPPTGGGSGVYPALDAGLRLAGKNFLPTLPSFYPLAEKEDYFMPLKILLLTSDFCKARAVF